MASVLDSIDDFLSRCQQSGDVAYAALCSVLDRLEDPATRPRARVFLADIQKRFPTKDDWDRCFSFYHFRIEDIFLDQYEEQQQQASLEEKVSLHTALSFIYGVQIGLGFQSCFVPPDLITPQRLFFWGDSVDDKIKKLDAELSRYKEQIKKTRPDPALEALKAGAMRVLKQKRI